MANGFSLWEGQPRAQIPNLSGDTSAHVMKMRVIQNLPTIPSQLWGDKSQGFLLVLLLRCLRGKFLGLFRRAAVYIRMLLPGLVYTAQEEQGTNGKLVPPKDPAEAPSVWDICDQFAKSTYILFHMYHYSAAINNKDNGSKRRPNFIFIWPMKKTELNLFFLEGNTRLSRGSQQGTTQPWNKTKKLYQVSATLFFIKQFQSGDCLWKEPNKVLPACAFFFSPFPTMALAFFLKTEDICLHSEDSWSSFRVLVTLLVWKNQ